MAGGKSEVAMISRHAPKKPGCLERWRSCSSELSLTEDEASSVPEKHWRSELASIVKRRVVESTKILAVGTGEYGDGSFGKEKREEEQRGSRDGGGDVEMGIIFVLGV